MANETFLEPGKVLQFAQNLEHVGQQMQSRLVQHVNADLAFTEKGDRFTHETFGLSEPQEVMSDWTDTPEGKVPQFRRAAFGKMYHDGKFVGAREDAEKLISPKNAVVQAMGYGRERRRDKIIVERGLFAPTQLEYTQDGDVQAVAFPTANIVPYDDVTYFRGKADGATAPSTGKTLLTPAKVRKAKVLLDKGQNMRMRPPTILYEEEDLQNLMTSAELTDGDLTVIKRLESGEIDTWGGIKWAKVEQGTLPKVPGQSSRWYTALYLPDYLIYKDRPLVQTQISQRADKSYNWHAYYRSQDFLMRTQDSAFVWIPIER